MSKSAGKKPKEKSDKTKADNFVWTDDEVQLLLEVTNDYKVSKAAKNIDWESCQSKYTDILELYREHYPSSQEESAEIEKEYPHKKEEITKVILTSYWGRKQKLSHALTCLSCLTLSPSNLHYLCKASSSLNALRKTSS